MENISINDILGGLSLYQEVYSIGKCYGIYPGDVLSRQNPF